MASLESVKRNIKRLYEVHPNVHMDVFVTTPKLSLKNAEAKIVGVYAHLFRIEEMSTGVPQYHTLQYTDVLTRHIVILELEKTG